ncbi:acyltransferase [Sphingopyxis indica]|uniref:acyltransferase family protein n=1 Tax=Sphingopyxis indica TaxID=436663 RepID=UPI002939065E|nr:acyltransferase [Sphingopyxis indica]WOF44582.1 acyltransferase [Sphingopyxis indica]
MPTNDAAKGGGYIAGLDGIRAISVSLVMIAHFGFADVVPGGLGVTIFFFVSGFLITTLLLQERAQFGRISLPNFYARRFLRLSPELLLLIIFGSTLGLSYSSLRMSDVVSAITYTTNYYALYSEHSLNEFMRWPHLWSLAVEEHFYLSFPLVVLLFGKRARTVIWILASVCASILIWRLCIAQWGAPFGWGNAEHPYTYLATDTRIDSIAYGCLSGALLQDRNFRAHSIVGSYTAIAAAGILMLFSLLYRDIDFRETVRYSLQGASLMLLFYGLFGRGGAPVIWLLEIAPLRHLGVLSYGAYLWHLEIIRVFEYVTDITPDSLGLSARIAFALVGSIATFIVADASFRLTAPVRRWRKNFHMKTSQVSAGAP